MKAIKLIAGIGAMSWILGIDLKEVRNSIVFYLNHLYLNILFYGYFLFWKITILYSKLFFLFLFYLFRTCCIKMMIWNRGIGARSWWEFYWCVVMIGIFLYCSILCWLENICYEIKSLSCSLFYQWLAKWSPHKNVYLIHVHYSK